MQTIAHLAAVRSACDRVGRNVGNFAVMFNPAGFPSISTEQASQCFERPFVITCHHQYKTTDAPLWLKDGAQVEDGIDEIAIEDRTVTLLNVSQNIFAERETSFQCCVEMPSGALVSGELYIFDPLGKNVSP